MNPSNIFNFFSFALLTIICVKYVELVRVCKSFESYFKRDSIDCYDNPDTRLNVTEILRRRWNCTAEEYKITTDDGYQILVIRAYKEILHPTPIIIGHGILMNSLGLLTLYNQSLVYHTIYSGRQVFLINFRGTRYSTGHTGNITKDDYAYWSFSIGSHVEFRSIEQLARHSLLFTSIQGGHFFDAHHCFHEMAQYDIPQILSLVKTITGKKAIIVAYSLSSTASLIYATLFPKDSSKNLKGIITMATTIFFKNSTSKFMKIAKIFPKILFLSKYLWNGKLFCSEKMQKIMEYASKGPTQFLSIYNPLSSFSGYDFEGITPEYFPVEALNALDCAGENVALHFAQIINSGKFRQFDHGLLQNMKKYGTLEPPMYELSNIRVPVAQILGRGDILATVEDAKDVDLLLNPKFCCGITLIDYKNWSHDDFIFSRFQIQFLIPVVLKKITAMEANSC